MFTKHKTFLMIYCILITLLVMTIKYSLFLKNGFPKNFSSAFMSQASRGQH